MINFTTLIYYLTKTLKFIKIKKKSFYSYSNSHTKKFLHVFLDAKSLVICLHQYIKWIDHSTFLVTFSTNFSIMITFENLR